MQIPRTVPSLRDAVRPLFFRGKSVALVPTMGALHSGHMSLVKLAKKYADVVVVSLFVNPRQFGAGEDLAQYPRQERRDLEILEHHGVDIAYVPSETVMYPKHFSTTISVGGVSEGLCGAHRPGHFDGVATVVTKLLLQVSPDILILGEKDYQQLMVVKRLIDDLDMEVSVIGAPIARESDGLALSSRNMYLTAEQRPIAPRLYATLLEVRAELQRHPEEVETIIDKGKQALLNDGFSEVEYLELRDSEMLTPAKYFSQHTRLLVAARLGNVRLIDNIPAGDES